MIFIFATPLEAQPFRSACPHAKIEICGVGAAECAAFTSSLIARMRREGSKETLILAGIAGSYSLSDVALCEVVEVVSEQIESLPQRFRKEYQNKAQTSLRSVSSNSVNSSAEMQGITPTAQIENMEGATFMAICIAENIPYMEIRAISNQVGEPFDNWKLSEACIALSTTLGTLFSLS